MPKYFTDERTLPFAKVELRTARVTTRDLERIFQNANEASICAAFADFPRGCLGYVFNVRKRATRYTLRDIVGIEVLIAENTEDLCSIMNHVMGAVFSEHWQAVFQRRRNEIGLPTETDRD